jgi:signal transduction histidine kinase
MGEDQNFLSSIDITSSNLLISKSIIYKYCVGHVGQLTKDQIAIADVIEAAKITMHQIKLSKNGLNLLPYFFLIRQFYTGLKYGTSNVRRENLLSLIKFSMSINFRKRIALLIAILLVTLNLCLSAPTNILGKLRNRIAS